MRLYWCCDGGCRWWWWIKVLDMKKKSKRIVSNKKRKNKEMRKELRDTRYRRWQERVISGYGCVSFCNGYVLKTISSVCLSANWIGVMVLADWISVLQCFVWYTDFCCCGCGMTRSFSSITFSTLPQDTFVWVSLSLFSHLSGLYNTFVLHYVSISLTNLLPSRPEVQNEHFLIDRLDRVECSLPMPCTQYW